MLGRLGPAQWSPQRALQSLPVTPVWPRGHTGKLEEEFGTTPVGSRTTTGKSGELGGAVVTPKMLRSISGKPPLLTDWAGSLPSTFLVQMLA